MITKNMLSKIRLFPTLMMVGVLALGLKVFSITEEFSILNSPVQAQQKSSETQDKDVDQKAKEEAQASSPSDQPLIIGMPPAEEMELILQLKHRREQLEGRAAKLDLQEQLLASTEKRIDDKIVELKSLEDAIKISLGQYDEREKKKMNSVVKVYETMKAKDAAKIFETLSSAIQLDVATRMKPKKIADIMAKMQPQKASALTTQLATYAQPPAYNSVKKN